jgi:hypothetical protein
MGPRTTAFRIERGGSYRWLAIGCGSLILIAVVGLGGLALVCKAAVDPPAEAAKAFFADVRAQNYAAALQRMGPAHQQVHTMQSFQSLLASQPSLLQHTDDTIRSRHIDDDNAEIEATLDTPRGPRAAKISLVRLGGYWYIESISVSP